MSSWHFLLRDYWVIKNFALLTFIRHLASSVINYVMNVMDFDLIALVGVLSVSCSCYYLSNDGLSVVIIIVVLRQKVDCELQRL